MNHVHELLQSGDLAASLKEAMQAVRQDAGNAKHRIALFQLMCLTGDWEKARRQLYVLKDMSAETIPMFETYDPVIQCEMFRGAVFRGLKSPLFFGEPRDWLATLSSALPKFAAGQTEEGLDLQGRAFEQAPESAGSVDGRPFEWIADADSRLGPVLEVFLRGRYYWVAIEHVSFIRFDEPEDLRDLVWTPAQFQWKNGGEAVGFIPTRYPGTELADDDRLKLSRMTAWAGDEDGLQTGLGQRLLATDEAEYPLLGIRELQIGAAEEHPGSEAGAEGR
ncbi:MAG: type VI secretion system accessory protein TagJ [Wenzhouxiangella sp.]